MKSSTAQWGDKIEKISKKFDKRGKEMENRKYNKIRGPDCEVQNL